MTHHRAELQRKVVAYNIYVLSALHFCRTLSEKTTEPIIATRQTGTQDGELRKTRRAFSVSFLLSNFTRQILQPIFNPLFGSGLCVGGLCGETGQLFEIIKQTCPEGIVWLHSPPVWWSSAQPSLRNVPLCFTTYAQWLYKGVKCPQSARRGIITGPPDFNWHNLVNVEFIWTKIWDNIAEEMLNLRVWK